MIEQDGHNDVTVKINQSSDWLGHIERIEANIKRWDSFVQRQECIPNVEPDEYVSMQQCHYQFDFNQFIGVANGQEQLLELTQTTLLFASPSPNPNLNNDAVNSPIKVRLIQVVTPQEEPQVELSQSEPKKMRALVNLSDGVAHDYNNIFGVISGYCELMELDFEHEPKLQGYVKQINGAIERSQVISEQLFYFARRRKAGQLLVDFEEVILQPIMNFKKQLPDNIQFDWLLAKTQAKVRLNKEVLSKVVLALGNNAINAMPEGGSLRFVCCVENVNSELAQQLSMGQGEHLCFSVVDNGCGIAASELNHVLEPYFSSSKGSLGLGLSMVYGFCKNAGGGIFVESVFGQGTSVKLYFPLVTS